MANFLYPRTVKRLHLQLSPEWSCFVEDTRACRFAPSPTRRLLGNDGNDPSIYYSPYSTVFLPSPDNVSLPPSLSKPLEIGLGVSQSVLLHIELT